MRIAIITPSYRNDLALATDLAASIDRFVPAEIEHVLVVPRRDVGMFAPLAGARRRVVANEAILAPYGMRRLPLPVRVGIPGLGWRRVREQWWYPGTGRVGGWVTQQITKLAAMAVCDADVLVFADSDTVLFRPLDAGRFVAGSAVLLHRSPLAAGLDQQAEWYRTARRLLGIEDDGAPAADFVGNLIGWRRDLVRALQRHLETVHGVPWPRAVARERAVSEYMLYGVFCTEVLGIDATGHRLWESDLTHSIWTEAAALDPASFRAGLRDSHVALHLQSTLPLSPATRRAFIASVLETA